MMARFGGVVVAGGVLALSVAALGAATAFGPDYQVPLHQPMPITAAGFGTHSEQCGSIPDTEDGWHFVLPGDFTVFVSLTVTFSPGGTQTITSFGTPTVTPTPTPSGTPTTTATPTVTPTAPTSPSPSPSTSPAPAPAPTPVTTTL